MGTGAVTAAGAGAGAAAGMGAAPPPRPGRLMRMVCLASGLGGRPMRTVAFFCVGAGAAPGCGGAGILIHPKNLAETGCARIHPTLLAHLITEDFFGKILLDQPKSRDSRLAGDRGGCKLLRMLNSTEPQSSQPIIAMCRPTYFGVQYEINSRMEENIGQADVTKLAAQAPSNPPASSPTSASS